VGRPKCRGILEGFSEDADQDAGPQRPEQGQSEALVLHAQAVTSPRSLCHPDSLFRTSLEKTVTKGQRQVTSHTPP
jgi:hypothetical protein